MSTFSLTDKQLTAIRADDAKTAHKAALEVVKSTATAYAKLASRLHVTAAVAGFLASKHGDPAALNTMFQWLKPNDRVALKNWLVDAATFEVTIEADSDEPATEKICWLAIKTDNQVPVVAVKKNTKKLKFSERREEMTLEDWLALENFSERNNKDDEELKSYNLFAAIQKEVKRADTIAAGDSDKYVYDAEDDKAAMLSRVLHACINDSAELSKLYAQCAPTPTLADKAQALTEATG